MNNFFSFLGKLLVFAGIAGILIGGGYYLGAKLGKAPKKIQSVIVITKVPSPMPTVATVSGTIAPTKAFLKTVTPTIATASSTIVPTITKIPQAK